MAASGKITMSEAAAVYGGTTIVWQPSHRRRRSTSDACTHTHTAGAAGGYGAERGCEWYSDPSSLLFLSG